MTAIWACAATLVIMGIARRRHVVWHSSSGTREVLWIGFLHLNIPMKERLIPGSSWWLLVAHRGYSFGLQNSIHKFKVISTETLRDPWNSTCQWPRVTVIEFKLTFSIDHTSPTGFPFRFTAPGRCGLRTASTLMPRKVYMAGYGHCLGTQGC